MCQLWRRIVAAGLMMGGLVGCATMPDSIAGRHGVATASIMPAVHLNPYFESGRKERRASGVELIPTTPSPSSVESSAELLSAEVSL